MLPCRDMAKFPWVRGHRELFTCFFSAAVMYLQKNHLIWCNVFLLMMTTEIKFEKIRYMVDSHINMVPKIPRCRMLDSVNVLLPALWSASHVWEMMWNKRNSGTSRFLHIITICCIWIFSSKTFLFQPICDTDSCSLQLPCKNQRWKEWTSQQRSGLYIRCFFLTCLATAVSVLVARPSSTNMERAVRLAVAGIGWCCCVRCISSPNSQ